MALANFDLEVLREKIRGAYKSDDPVLAKFREYARRLKVRVKALRSYAVNAGSFVSADGGDNRLTFNPAVVELVPICSSDEGLIWHWQILTWKSCARKFAARTRATIRSLQSSASTRGG